MGAVTEPGRPVARPWTVSAAAVLLWAIAAGLAAVGVRGAVLVATGETGSATQAAGILLVVVLLALWHWSIGMRLFRLRNAMGQAMFAALLWLPVGYFLREAAHPVIGFGTWALAAVLAVLLLAPRTRAAIGFGGD
jgi:hypothetical protein